MVISHEHRYLFIEFPRTGTTAVSRELCQQYGGKRILNKHSTYNEFLKIASPEEKKYFVFSCIRNPLDDAVSHYFKLKTDHQERYTKAVQEKKPSRIADWLDLLMFREIHKKNMDFPAFFRRFYVIPYNNWNSMILRRYNYVMRFENLEQDFTTALNMIGLELKRPLPPRNITSERAKEFWAYYTPEIIPRAKWVFGPFMKQWEYSFPAEWGNQSIPWWSQVEFEFFNFFRRFYWLYLRPYI